MKLAILGTILVLALLVAACSDQSGDDAADVVGTTWQWQQFEDAADEISITVESPENYTLALAADGTANIQADCNQLAWTYKMAGSELTFDTTGPSTLAFCGEESLDQQFLQRLGNTATYATSDGNLYLNLQADAGNLIFAPAE